jgi:flagellar biogenesis protein FliO
MSWIHNTRWFALASLFWLAPVYAQTPQLAPPQYGPSDGASQNQADPGPSPNFTPPPALPSTNEDREYLRLLNQPAANPSPTPTTVNTAPATLPAAANPVYTNNGSAAPAAVSSPAKLPQNVATRPEPQPSSPNIQATYTQPLTASTKPAPLPLNAAGIAVPENNAPANNAPRPINPNGAKPIPLAGPNTKSPAAANSWSNFGTMLGSLAIVLGLFVVTIKLLRRGMPGAKQRLGSNVVEVLGQTPLAPRQTLQVIRFGNKILLVAMSPDGCDTLTEITDPLEVDRLAGMCQQSQANSSTKTFGELFRQVTSLRPPLTEPAAEVPAAGSTLDEVRARLRGGSISAREVTHG